jgi:16S rRNA (cytosine967-C5)-methyltransferase
MSARQVAARVLVRVFHEEAYAAPALSAELDRADLESRDRGLATELTYGVLRTQKYLETRLEKWGRLKPGDASLRAHLLVGAYQLEFLDRVPAHAAVHEAVELVRRDHDRKVGGFANAVLRRLSEDVGGRSSLREATWQSSPSFLRKRLVRELGEEGARQILFPEEKRAPFLRVLGKTPSPDLLAWLEARAEAVPGVPNAFRFTAGGDPRKNEFFEQGQFVVQELGAQLIGHFLGVEPGHAVLDVCAGRGQKTSLLAELSGAEGRVVATDLFDHKVRALADEMVRLGLSVEAYQWDFTTPPPQKLEGVFDRVLVDAPCTGVGTLSRRPEIARRLTPEDPARLGALQLTIARNAARCLRPGGLLVFSTCSVLSEEGPAVVDELERGGLRRAAPRLLPDLALGLVPESSTLRLSPSQSDTDGYFIAWLEK